MSPFQFSAWIVQLNKIENRLAWLVQKPCRAIEKKHCLVETTSIESKGMKKIFPIISGALLAIMVGYSGVSQAEQPADSTITLISNVNIFDGKTEELLKNTHVLVKDNPIETVSDEPLAVIQTDNVTMIDDGGR
jgi:hypothetical protein